MPMSSCRRRIKASKPPVMKQETRPSTPEPRKPFIARLNIAMMNKVRDREVRGHGDLSAFFDRVIEWCDEDWIMGLTPDFIDKKNRVVVFLTLKEGNYDTLVRWGEILGATRVKILETVAAEYLKRHGWFDPAGEDAREDRR